METGIKVGDCMKTSLVVIPDSTLVVDAARKMAETGVGSLLVTNEKGIYGIVTERDLVTKVLASGKTNSKAIREICTKTLISIPATDDISLAAKLMGERAIKRLVVTLHGKIVGIISQKDLISIAPSLYDFIAEEKQPAKLKIY